MALLVPCKDQFETGFGRPGQPGTCGLLSKSIFSCCHLQVSGQAPQSTESRHLLLQNGACASSILLHHVERAREKHLCNPDFAYFERGTSSV
jgi:hypothetical protein